MESVSYDDIIAAATARILRNARITGPLMRACRLADVTPQALADGIGVKLRHVAWYDFGGGDLEETRRIASLSVDFIEARWADFPKSAELEAALVALQTAIYDE